jgi:hypothetical protein
MQPNSRHDANHSEKIAISLLFPSTKGKHENSVWKILNCNHHHHQYYCPCYCCFISRVSSFRLHFLCCGMAIWFMRIHQKYESIWKDIATKHEKNDSMTIVNYRFFLPFISASSFCFLFLNLLFLVRTFHCFCPVKGTK